MNYILEVCSFNLPSCLVAEKCGAQRIELCDNPEEGGTTPSYGTLKVIKEKCSIAVYPIIRPRGGDFCYDDEEIAIMKHDIRLCKELGFDGVVIGLLNREGTVDHENTSSLVDLAYPMGVTFHRAFDRAKDPFAAMEQIIGSGCERILTSGLKPTAPEGADLIAALVKQAEERIIIMPGSGVRSTNIAALALKTGAFEFHTSARIKMNSRMEFINDEMHESLQTIMADEIEINKILQVLNRAEQNSTMAIP